MVEERKSRGWQGHNALNGGLGRVMIKAVKGQAIIMSDSRTDGVDIIKDF